MPYLQPAAARPYINLVGPETVFGEKALLIGKPQWRHAGIHRRVADHDSLVSELRQGGKIETNQKQAHIKFLLCIMNSLKAKHGSIRRTCSERLSGEMFPSLLKTLHECHDQRVCA